AQPHPRVVDAQVAAVAGACPSGRAVIKIATIHARRGQHGGESPPRGEILSGHKTSLGKRIGLRHRVKPYGNIEVAVGRLPCELELVRPAANESAASPDVITVAGPNDGAGRRGAANPCGRIWPREKRDDRVFGNSIRRRRTVPDSIENQDVVAARGERGSRQSDALIIWIE